MFLGVENVVLPLQSSSNRLQVPSPSKVVPIDDNGNITVEEFYHSTDLLRTPQSKKYRRYAELRTSFLIVDDSNINRLINGDF